MHRRTVYNLESFLSVRTTAQEQRKGFGMGEGKMEIDGEKFKRVSCFVGGVMHYSALSFTFVFCQFWLLIGMRVWNCK